MQLGPTFLLVFALGLFLLSARPWPTLARLAWIVGGGMSLAIGAFMIANAEEHYGLFRLAGDLWSNRGDLSQSVFATSLERNGGSVVRHVIPLLDLFLLLGAALGVIALLALTPGDAIERVVRPAIFTVVGTMIGVVLALSVVAVGFGGVVNPRGYAGFVQEQDVYDGDTIWLGETSLRLYGVEAPERNQACISGAPCGDIARSYLAALVKDTLVRCEARTTRRGSVKEALGRPLVQCFARPISGDEFDIGRRMIETGHATVYEREHPEEYATIVFESNREGAIEECWEVPRHRRAERGSSRRTVGVC